MLKRKTFRVLCVAFITFAIVGMASAQPGGARGGGRGQGGPGGGRGGFSFNREDMMKRMTERLKERLDVGDAEWKIVQPRLTKVMSLQAEARGGGGSVFASMFSGRGGDRGARGGGDRGGGDRGARGGGDRGGRGGGDGGGQSAREQNDVQKATQALNEVLEQDDATPAQIKSKLTALRAAKEKANQKLAAAQKSLREVLTLKQEAQLVMMGQLK